MAQEKIPVTLITDNMTGYLMELGEIDTVVVGTGRVAVNGAVVNKIAALYGSCISKYVTTSHFMGPVHCQLLI